MNRELLKKTKEFQPDLIWLEKALYIYPETLRSIKQFPKSCFIIYYSPDDYLNPENISRHFLRSIPFYDLVVTTKSYNMEELRSFGVHNLFFSNKAFCPEVHRPHHLSSFDRLCLGSRVGFIGTYEAERGRSMLCLARAGIEVRIWGNGWSRLLGPSHSKLRIEGRPIWGEEYARAISTTDINLCFLRKVNRDKVTQRSIEIPACGGFMLAERTDEHTRLFDEGKEAEFFGSDDELIDKVRYYLIHEDERSVIARAGRERCLVSGYSYPERLAEILTQAALLKEEFKVKG